MRRVVWKYPLKQGPNVVSMPGAGIPLHVESQRYFNEAFGEIEGLVLWALVYPESPLVDRTFVVVGTGTDLPEPDTYLHVGTAMQLGGALVWHVFEDVR